MDSSIRRIALSGVTLFALALWAPAADAAPKDKGRDKAQDQRELENPNANPQWSEDATRGQERAAERRDEHGKHEEHGHDDGDSDSDHADSDSNSDGDHGDSDEQRERKDRKHEKVKRERVEGEPKADRRADREWTADERAAREREASARAERYRKTGERPERGEERMRDETNAALEGDEMSAVADAAADEALATTVAPEETGFTAGIRRFFGFGRSAERRNERASESQQAEQQNRASGASANE